MNETSPLSDFSAYDDLGDSVSMVGICAPSNHGTAEYEAYVRAVHGDPL